MVSDAKFFEAARAQRAVDDADEAQRIISRLMAWDDDNMLKEAAADLLRARRRRIAKLEAALREIAALGDVDCDTAPTIAKRALSE